MNLSGGSPFQPPHILIVFVDRMVADSPIVQSLRSRVDAAFEIVQSADTVYGRIGSETDPVSAGKRFLFLTQNKGAFIRNCPGTPSYLCCGYQILHTAAYCPLDCAYCILQSYFHPPVLQYFVNHADLFVELDQVFQTEKTFRIGTGEFTDSLIWEPWTDLAARLVVRFGKQSRSVLELKTKTTAVHSLKELPHHRKTIVAWSLNTPRVIGAEERGTAPLPERLAAASFCESRDFPIAFHFDPMVLYDGCREEYTTVVDDLFSAVSAENIAWISLGTFRYMPDLKPIVQARFPESKILYGEFIPGLDRKMRYFKPLRINLYAAMVERIRQYGKDVTIYLCMEDNEVWQKSLGFLPAERGGLPAMLDKAAERVCRLEKKQGRLMD